MTPLPKGKGEYRGIELVEAICKMINTIINSHFRTAISIHDSLHGFRQEMGTGTVTLEVKMVQQMVGIFNKPLFQMFLDVKNAYESLDRMWCMKIFQGYGIGKNL